MIGTPGLGSVLGLGLLTLLLAAACADEDLRSIEGASRSEASDDVTPVPATPKILTTLTKTADGTVVERTPVPGASLPPLPPPRIARPAGLWLIDVRSNENHRLHDAVDTGGSGFEWWGIATFAADGSVWLGANRIDVVAEHFSSEGVRLPVSAGDGPSSTPRCRQPKFDTQRAAIGGREYDANCGAISPDGRFMTWRERPSDGGFQNLPVFLLDVTSGVSRRLPIESRGGVGDSYWSDRWSPSGDFVIVMWFGDDEAHLADRSGNVRLVGRHAHLFSANLEMSWSPREEAYLSPGLEGVPFMEWPASGRRVEFPGARWPLAFDVTGTFVSWIDGVRVSSNPQDEPGQRVHPSTVVASVATGEVVARWQGAQASYFREPLRGVSVFDGRPVGLMERDDRTPRPDGRLTADSLWNTTTIVHHPLLAAPLELVRSGGATWSPDALQVAFARADFSERVFEATATTGRAFSIDRSWVVEVLDVRTGARREVTRVPNSDGPPVIEWSPGGDALLVSFPRPSGI